MDLDDDELKVTLEFRRKKKDKKEEKEKSEDKDDCYNLRRL